MTHPRRLICAALTLTLTAGCGDDGDEEEPGVCAALEGEEPGEEARLKHDNSSRFTNIQLAEFFPNGLMLSEALLSGETVNGVRLVSAENVMGQPVTAVEIEDSTKEFSYETMGGLPNFGPMAFPLILTYERDDGTKARVAIEEQFELADIKYDQGPLFHYAFVWELDEGSGWSAERTDLCLDGEGDEVEALLLNGSWDFSTGERLAGEGSEVTLACRESALAKCVEWAYRELDEPTTSWAHQACVRMVRADYAGDGATNTFSGARIYVGDDLGLIEQSSYPGWLVKEAEWNADGAICINREALRNIDPDSCDDCFAGVPECTELDNLDPSSTETLVSAVSLSAFGDTHMLYGVQYEEGVGTHLFYSEQDGGDVFDVGLIKDEEGNPGVEIDAIFQSDFDGLAGFEIDRENGRSRMVHITGTGQLEIEGDWLEGHLMRGAAVSDDFNRHLVWALSSNTDQLCPIWVANGNFPPETLPCLKLPQSISEHVDLVENSVTRDFTIVDGGTVWRLDADIDNLFIGEMERLADTPHTLVGLARRVDSELLVASDVSEDKVVELTGLMGCSESSRDLLPDISPGAFGDLAGSPP